MTRTERDERLQKAKQISIHSYLKGIGIEPTNETGSSYLYQSPLRSESVPSFNVSKVKNSWKDFGTGEKGDLPDLVMLLNRTTLHEAIDMILGTPQRPDTIFEPRKSDRKNVEIVSIGKLYSKYLIDYIQERRIDLDIAREYLVELSIRFPNGKFPDRTTQVIGFKNDSGGYEMRSRTIKISNSPKNVTTIKGTNHGKIRLYEGFFSFLSSRMAHGRPFSATVVVLNSLSFLPQMIDFWKEDYMVFSFLDNDKAGDKAVKLLSDSIFNHKDWRCLYEGYNDYNDYLCGKRQKKPIRSIKELTTL
jgi:hypothetical protein